MTTWSLTYDQALNILRETVEERPDFVYEAPDTGDYAEAKCMYFFNDEPSCLVGHLMWRLGGEPLMDEVLDRGYNTEGISSVLLSGLIEADTKTRTLLTQAQSVQDDGVPWREALDEAITFTEESW